MMETTQRLCSLDNLKPFLVAANVRRAFNSSDYAVVKGIGKKGDLVIGHVQPKSDQSAIILDQSHKPHVISKPQRVVAVLGPRDSSTHVCATIPDGGLWIDQGLSAHWVAGESGIVGCLEKEASTRSIHAAETSLEFQFDGLIVDHALQPVNVRNFAVPEHPKPTTTPIILVSASSSESGKTVLAGKIIRRLSDAGLRVGALKVTGTGGVLDSLHHSNCGAICTLDNVDAGLITTGGDTEEFRQRIPSIFRHIEQSGVDVIVAELGGDVVSANNPEVFCIREIIDNATLMIVISNDALAAAGFNALNQSRFGFPEQKLWHFTSPFRNHAGMRRRMKAVGISDCYDPNAADCIQQIVDPFINLKVMHELN